MFKIKKFAIVFIFALILTSVIFVPGCVRAPAPRIPRDPVQIGIMLSIGGEEHDSFNYAAIEGLKKAMWEGIEYQVKIPNSIAEMDNILRYFAEQEMELIISVGSVSADALTVAAREFPENKFAIIDAEVDLPNVASLVFNEHKGSFLAGALAALMTETEKVGFVGGMEMPFIQKFQAGFEHGVEHVNEIKGKSVKVISAYAGTTGKAFRNPAKGRELALSHMNAGADIIYHVSGRTGIGVFDAAVEREKIALGVISKQNWYAPGHVIANMLKRLDIAVYNLAKSVDNNTFAAGTIYYGEVGDGAGIANLNDAFNVKKAGIENDAAKMAILQGFKESIPNEVIEFLKVLEQKIKDGEIVVRDALGTM
jgi:basic membrane protein A